MPYTRETIETEFKVERNLIISPGQFEGQPRYAPYFVEKAAGRNKTVVTIRDEDRREFPELADYKIVVLDARPDGRVLVTPYTSLEGW